MPGDLTMCNPTSPRATPRRGMALPIALGAIVIIGALIVGVFFASTQDYRASRNSLSPQRAMHAADVGLSSVVSSWTVAHTNGTRVGRSGKLADTTIDGVSVTRRYTRVSPTVFWITVTATQGGGSLDSRAEKRLNGIMRVESPDFKIMGPITSRGRTEIGGNTKVSGTDTVLAGWECPPGGAPGAGMIVNDSASNVMYQGIKYELTGDPKVKDSTAMVGDTATFSKFGGFNFDQLAAKATKVRSAPGGAGALSIAPTHLAPGVCNTADDNNWGDTSHVNGPRGCEDYYPIVHLQGATNQYTLGGSGGGQGIILVDGNLVLAGSFKWSGLVLVKGSTTVAGTSSGGGVKIVGGIMAMNRVSPADTNSFIGASSITFSRCAIQQVTSRVATVQPLRARSWADLSF
jgi:hypothetical protein